MKKGDISDPVLSPEGYHIIDLRDVREGKVRSFDEVKPELTKQYLETEREHRYSDISGKLTDAIYKDPSLEAAAKSLGLPLQKTGLFARIGGASGIIANTAVVKAAFSNSVLAEGNTSDPIELGPNHIVLVHVDQHEKPVLKPLDGVRDDIRKTLVDEQIAKQAKERADTLFARLQKGETLDQVAGVLKLKVEEAKDIGRNAANLDGQAGNRGVQACAPASGGQAGLHRGALCRTTLTPSPRSRWSRMPIRPSSMRRRARLRATSSRRATPTMSFAVTSIACARAQKSASPKIAWSRRAAPWHW